LKFKIFFLFSSISISYHLCIHSVLNRYEQAYRDETVHFISLLTGQETTPRSCITDYPVTAKIAEAAARSLKSGKPESLV
jgi:hypothetical protein